MKSDKNKPIAILISDIHYNLQTLPLADAATRQAIMKANELRVPLIVAGDLHDSKANMRAECVNAMIETFKLAETEVYIMRGNHDQINEKSRDHSLNFLTLYVKHIVTEACYRPYGLDVYMIPYHSDVLQLKHTLSYRKPEDIIIMHQGLMGSESGEYIQDRTAITKADVAGLRIISGHYHRRQAIKLPNNGQWDYIGNPYTLNFGEANDPVKGFQILHDDGRLEFVPTNLRKHVVVKYDVSLGEYEASCAKINHDDLVWVKATGTKEELADVNKKTFADELGVASFKLDLIPTDKLPTQVKKPSSQPELLDSIIDQLDATEDRRNLLKQTWKDMK